MLRSDSEQNGMDFIVLSCFIHYVVPIEQYAIACYDYLRLSYRVIRFEHDVDDHNMHA